MSEPKQVALSVQNRRDNRAALQRSRRMRERDRLEFEAQVACKMNARFFNGRIPSIIVLDYRYWQMRRCGWDVVDDRSPFNEGLDPRECSCWKWWTGIHWQQRANMVKLSHFRLRK